MLKPQRAEYIKITLSNDLFVRLRPSDVGHIRRATGCPVKHLAKAMNLSEDQYQMFELGTLERTPTRIELFKQALTSWKHDLIRVVIE